MSVKFKVGDIICMHTYHGSDHWQQVCKVLEVKRDHYSLQPIQSRTSDRGWSTESKISGCSYLVRGGWQEEQTTLFVEPTLEHEKKEQDNILRTMIREIVREELALLNTNYETGR